MSKKKRTADDRWQKWLADLDDEFRHEIVLNESDRGAVLVAAAFIEEALEHLLRQVFTVKSCNASSDKFPSQLDKLLRPGIDAPLGSFAARISACFALGIIDIDYFNALEALRSLRNNYAHRRTDGSRPQLSEESVQIIHRSVTGPGLWDLRFVGLLPDGVDFDSTIAIAGVPRIAFALAVWIMLRSIIVETEWWKTNGTPSTPIRSSPKFEGPTYRGHQVN